MKSKRHNAILELISNNSVTTQEDLMNMLNNSGFSVTQATVSRDIKELGLIKVIDKNTNQYKYSTVDFKSEDNDTLKLMGIFGNSVKSMEAVNNIVVLKCYTGLGQGVCASIDSMNIENIAGTIAGDDTVFVLTRSDKSANKIITKFNQIIKE